MDFIPPNPLPDYKQQVSRSRAQTLFLVLMIGALNTIAPISIDMYLPAFPKIAASLHARIGDVALSLSTYFFGFALGQILYGPLLDRFGRKRPLYIGLCLYIIATLACAWSWSIEMLWVMRFLQALSGCVASVGAMAMVLDFFRPDQSARIFSLLILILGVSPLLAPTLGSLIIASWNWRYVFVTLSIVALIVLVIVFLFLPEGREPDQRISLRPRPILRGFRDILTNSQFYVYALAGTFSFAGLFVYVAGSPAVFMEEYHVGARAYGGIFASLSVGFIGSSQLNHWLTRKFSNEQILKTVLTIQPMVAILFLILVLGGAHSLVLITGFLFVLLACCGLTYPNGAAVALRPFTKNAGTASALLGFIQIGIGGMTSAAIGILKLKASLALALVMALSACIAFALLLLDRKK